MDVENDCGNLDGSVLDVSMKSPSPTKGGRISSPRKRAFRERNTEVTEIPEQLEEPVVKRTRQQRAPSQIPEPCTAHADWILDLGCDGGALLLEEKQCILGTSDGRVVFCDFDGHVTQQITLSRPVGALFRDNGHLYAWCHAKRGYDKWKGALVDLSLNTVPLTLFDLIDFGDVWIHASMVDGCLALADNKGNVGVFGCDGVPLWKKEQPLAGDGNFLHADMTGMYVAHKKVVRCHNLGDGEVKWEYRTTGGRNAVISSGYTEGDSLYIETDGKVVELDKATGEEHNEFVPYRHAASGAFGGNGKIITGNGPSIIFDKMTQDELHRVYMPVRIDQAIMKMTKNDKFLAFWDKFYCINLTEDVLEKAKAGKYMRTFNRRAPEASGDTKKLFLATMTSDDTISGILLQCDSEKSADDDVIRVHVVSDDYNPDWPVLLPRDVREPNKQFTIEKLIPSELGKFYRVDGALYEYKSNKSEDADVSCADMNNTKEWNENAAYKDKSDAE